MFKLPPVNSIDFSQKWHWFLPIWNGQGVHKTDKEVITILPACRIPQKDLKGHESLKVKNAASCERPAKYNKKAALKKAPSINKKVSIACCFETRCFEKIFNFCVEKSRSYTKTDSATRNINGCRLPELKATLIANSISQIPLLISEAAWHVIHLKLGDFPMDKDFKEKPSF